MFEAHGMNINEISITMDISSDICFHIQVELDPITPNEDGTVDLPVTDVGTKLIITFEPSEPSEPISISPIEVTACAEPGTSYLSAFYDSLMQLSNLLFNIEEYFVCLILAYSVNGKYLTSHRCLLV